MAHCVAGAEADTLTTMMIEIGGFLALAGLMIGLFAWLRQDVRREVDGLRREIDGLRGEINGLREEVGREIGGLRGEIDGLRGEVNGLRLEIGDLRERMARLEGLLEGLREAIGGRHAA